MANFNTVPMNAKRSHGQLRLREEMFTDPRARTGAAQETAIGRTCANLASRCLISADLLVIDVDLTIAIPTDISFYDQFRRCVDQVIALRFDLEMEQAAQVGQWFRDRCGGAEYALMADVQHLIGLEPMPWIDPARPARPEQGFPQLFDAISAIDPAGFFAPQPAIVELLRSFRNKARLAILSDCPEVLSRKILGLTGFCPDRDFDLYRPWRRSDPRPPKMIAAEEIFGDICDSFQCPRSHAVSIGDTLRTDIIPARLAGLRAIQVGASGDIARLSTIEVL